MAEVSKAYEVLGLSPSRKVSGGSEERRGRIRVAEVKRAFLAKAKHAHPDAGGNNEAFHELSLALSRVLEDLKGTSELTRREILQEMRSFEDERLKEKFKSYDASLAMLFDLLNIKDDDDNGRADSGGGKKGRVGEDRKASSSSAPESESESGGALVDAGPLASALWTAYQGPQLDFPKLRRKVKLQTKTEASSAQVVVFPQEFEAELRSDAVGSDSLLNLVYGRQQFGEVREDKSPLISTEGEGSLSQNAKAPHQVSLYVTGERVATATYFEDLGGKEAIIRIFVHATKATMSIAYKHDVLSSFFGKYEVNMPQKHLKQNQSNNLHNEMNNDDDDPLHTLVKYWSPGVDHILWLTESDHIHTIQARKPSLPHHSHWLFPARVETHSIGGWYFRQNRRRQGRRNNEPKTYSVEAFLLTLSIHHLLQELELQC